MLEPCGKRITELRKKNNMSQKELAEKLGVDDSNVSRWEKDKIAPKLAYVDAMCAIFGITLYDFYGRDLSESEKQQAIATTDKTIVKLSSKGKRILLIALSVIFAIVLVVVSVYYGFIYDPYPWEMEVTIDGSNNGGILNGREWEYKYDGKQHMPEIIVKHRSQVFSEDNKVKYGAMIVYGEYQKDFNFLSLSISMIKDDYIFIPCEDPNGPTEKGRYRLEISLYGYYTVDGEYKYEGYGPKYHCFSIIE
ncbi:MAG: helix-turn-helix transcriptional regulator [Clostridia bacterium]